MLEQNPHENKPKLSATLDSEEFRGALDLILADRRNSAAERRGGPWWVPSDPGAVIISAPSGSGKQSEGRLPHVPGWYESSE